MLNVIINRAPSQKQKSGIVDSSRRNDTNQPTISKTEIAKGIMLSGRQRTEATLIRLYGNGSHKHKIFSHDVAKMFNLLSRAFHVSCLSLYFMRIIDVIDVF